MPQRPQWGRSVGMRFPSGRTGASTLNEVGRIDKRPRKGYSASDCGYDATLHAFEKSIRKLGVGQLDLLLLHQPLSCLRPHPRGVPGSGGSTRRWPGARDRRQQLHAEAPREPALQRLRGAGGKSDRDPSLLRAASAVAAERRARDSEPGVVPDRGNHLVPTAERSTFEDPTRRSVESTARRPPR